MMLTTAKEQRHGHLQMPHVPTLAEVRPAQANDLAAARDDGVLLRTLKPLDLHAHVDTAGNYWIGRNDGEVAEHERWVYVIPQEQLLEEDTWENIRYGTMEGCDGSYLMYANLGFMDELSELSRLQSGVLELGSQPLPVSIREELTIRRKVSTMRRNCTYIMSYEMFTMINANWDQNLHDVMHHYEAWCAAQNAEGYPLELVLRMHGLGEYVRASSNGWKWFKHVPSGPIS